MTPAFDVSTVGEPLVALVAERPGGWDAASFRPHVVGAELNLATGLARLGHEVAFIGAVGRDEPGRMIERRLRAERVDTRHLRRAAGPTGMLIRELRLFGAAEVVYARAGSAGATLSAQDVSDAAHTLAASRRLHVTGITPALSAGCREAIEGALEIASAAGARVSLDINHRAKLWSGEAARSALAPLVGGCDIVFGSDSELCLLTALPTPREAVEALHERGVRQVVRKAGAAGAEVHSAGGHVDRAPGHAVAVVDPIGAGDAFAAGYLSALLDGGRPADALRRGNLCGAYAISAVGDTTALPDRSRLTSAAPGAADALR